jgi:hypothetical protein
MDKFYFWLNKFLLLDVFLVFFFFIWFLVAAIAQSSGLDLGMSIWQQLWMPVIQPALGLVMLGAITSGVAKRLLLNKKV